MRSRFSRAGLLAAATALLGAHPAAQDSAARRFVGTWRLVSTEQRLADGTRRPFPAIGPNGAGYLIYTDAHRMCAMLMAPDRPKWAVATAPSEPELRSALDGLVAYCGTYEVDAAQGTVVHHVELDKVPNVVGTDRKRFFSFSGDRLVLRIAPPLAEGTTESSLTWQRVAP